MSSQDELANENVADNSAELSVPPPLPPPPPPTNNSSNYDITSDPALTTDNSPDSSEISEEAKLKYFINNLRPQLGLSKRIDIFSNWKNGSVWRLAALLAIFMTTGVFFGAGLRLFFERSLTQSLQAKTRPQAQEIATIAELYRNMLPQSSFTQNFLTESYLQLSQNLSDPTLVNVAALREAVIATKQNPDSLVSQLMLLNASLETGQLRFGRDAASFLAHEYEEKKQELAEAKTDNSKAREQIAMIGNSAAYFWAVEVLALKNAAGGEDSNLQQTIETDNAKLLDKAYSYIKDILSDPKLQLEKSPQSEAAYQDTLAMVLLAKGDIETAKVAGKQALSLINDADSLYEILTNAELIWQAAKK